MNFIKSLTLATTLLSTTTFIAQAEINVVTSVKPLHSITAAVMEGIGKPDLIVKGAASPHTYSMKPSQAKMIENADLVFWMGHKLESFLVKPIEALASKAMVVELMDSHGLKKLEIREGGGFDEHDHDDDGHKENENDSEEAHDKHTEESHDEHGRGEFDVHVWLDPENAKVMVNEIKESLKKIDPVNAKKYEINSKKVVTKLNQLVVEVSAKLAPTKGKGFVVFHDAYQYFENRFGIQVLGALTVNTDVMPGAKQLSEIREVIEHEKVNCLFSEPQFNPAIIKSIAKDTNVKTGILDPLGAKLDKGKNLYFDLLKNMMTSFKGC